MNFSAISSSFLGHSSLFTELLLMFWYLPVSLNVNAQFFGLNSREESYMKLSPFTLAEKVIRHVYLMVGGWQVQR